MLTQTLNLNETIGISTIYDQSLLTAVMSNESTQVNVALEVFCPLLNVLILILYSALLSLVTGAHNDDISYALCLAFELTIHEVTACFFHDNPVKFKDESNSKTKLIGNNFHWSNVLNYKKVKMLCKVGNFSQFSF
jgi:hypothetical protein